MSFSKFSIFICVVSCTALLLMLVLIYQIVSIQEEIKNSEINRYKSINLAYELFQSSEDLTRFARSYAATGNSIFKQRFNTVASIREGSANRPKNYGATYWYLSNDSSDKAAYGTPQSLLLLMKAAGFTKEELDQLALSQQRSNELIHLEERAFLAVEGKINIDGASNDVAAKSSAIELLFGERYERAKSGIMKPIRLVIDSVEQRTKDELKSLQSKMDSKITQLWLLIISVLIFVFLVSAYAVKKFVTPLKRLSEVDPLTNLYNRRSFYQRTKGVFKSAKSGQSYSLLMIDLDYFKNINDTYGHDVGDSVIKRFSLILKSELRDIDIISRWGGEEFVVLIPYATAENSYLIAERVRQAVEAYQLTLEPEKKVAFTVSIGLVTDCCFSGDVNDSIKLADDALYRAKTTGRNKVVFD